MVFEVLLDPLEKTAPREPPVQLDPQDPLDPLDLQDPLDHRELLRHPLRFQKASNVLTGGFVV
jgi:hypothetical protein